MIRKLLSILVLFLASQSIAQSFQSPEQFLGYPLGTKYTRHHQLLEYYQYISKTFPNMVKLEKYGKTNEGRDLMLAFVASPKNLQRLSAIQQQNLSLAGLANAEKINDMPALVWLSYNVHGNETSSSEAALLTLFDLVDPANSKTKTWLENTVVIIDPCLNPDGRDRYVNWFNSVVGKQYNVDPIAREHKEPWPSGRSNHYNFDLNRDWAWQTQVESQQRMKVYNQWLPQVHVDFHEQEIDGPYYFAPAAEPYHEVITKWQRNFQLLLGKNHAKYFDQNGWFYYTKESYDLLYPSYGDTYPVYNGSIGMTYEQAGGGIAGAGIIKADGEVLSLLDRLEHHHTTGNSTIETASKHHSQLLLEFESFFKDSKQGKIGEYKTYVMTSKSKNKINEVAKLLERNGIEYGVTTSNNFSGYQYYSGKVENFVNEGYQIAVSAFQPKSVMAKVLLEPKTLLSDSNTYDITTWSIPFAYGVKGYAVKERLSISAEFPKTFTIKDQNSSFGLLIPYQSFAAAKLLASLLTKGVNVRYASKPFSIGNQPYERGTLIVLKIGNPSNWHQLTMDACKEFEIQPIAVASGLVDKGPDFGSSDVPLIKQGMKVALISGEETSSLGAGEIWHFFEKQLNYPITLINAVDMAKANLKSFQVLIMPDGSYKSLADKLVTDKLKDFVKSGGKLIALENAVVKLVDADLGIKLKEDKASEKLTPTVLNKFADKTTDALSKTIPGAIYKVNMDATHPLAFGNGTDAYYTLKQDANLFEFLKEGWNVGTIDKDAYITGFVGYKLKSKLNEALIFGVQDMGSGSIIYLTDNPLFRNFWENGKLLFSNAVFLVGQ